MNKIKEMKSYIIYNYLLDTTLRKKVEEVEEEFLLYDEKNSNYNDDLLKEIENLKILSRRSSIILMDTEMRESTDNIDSTEDPILEDIVTEIPEKEKDNNDEKILAQILNAKMEKISVFKEYTNLEDIKNCLSSIKKYDTEIKISNKKQLTIYSSQGKAFKNLKV